MNGIDGGKLLKCPCCKNPFLKNCNLSKPGPLDRDFVLRICGSTNLYCYVSKSKALYIRVPELKNKWFRDGFDDNSDDTTTIWGCNCGFTTYNFRDFL